MLGLAARGTRAHNGSMVTRLQRALRLLIALLALSGAGALVTETAPAAAAPSAYASVALQALPEAFSGAVAARASSRRALRSARGAVFVTEPARLPLSAAAPPARCLRRAPRLYLRNCVFLR